MLRCQDCEFFRQRADGSPEFACDPFSTIKEPECLLKWQLTQLTVISRSHQATLDLYRRLAPLQEKMFKHLEREIDDAEESERWKQGVEDDDTDDDDGTERW